MAHRKAEFVRGYVEDYRGRYDPGEPPIVVISDMIADLLHLADAEGVFEEVDGMADSDPYLLLESARDNYEFERDNPDG